MKNEGVAQDRQELFNEVFGYLYKYPWSACVTSLLCAQDWSDQWGLLIHLSHIYLPWSLRSLLSLHHSGWKRRSSIKAAKISRWSRSSSFLLTMNGMRLPRWRKFRESRTFVLSSPRVTSLSCIIFIITFFKWFFSLFYPFLGYQMWWLTKL